MLMKEVPTCVEREWVVERQHAQAVVNQVRIDYKPGVQKNQQQEWDRIAAQTRAQARRAERAAVCIGRGAHAGRALLVR